MKNKIEIKDNKVVKTFGSRMNYVRESSIYEKLRGSGLAPELTSNWDGAIEHEYIQGESFEETIRKSMTSPLQFIKYSELFFEWYREFRDRVNLSLGDMDFSDFIISEGQLFCIDFEHCRPGQVEDDVAKLAAHICMAENAYTIFGMEDAKMFVKAAWEKLDMNSEKLYAAIKKGLESVAKTRGVIPMKSANEYLATFVCCSFAHKPSKKSEVASLLEMLHASRQMWTLFADDITGDAEKYVRYIMSAEKDDVDAVLLTDRGKLIDYPLLLRTRGSAIVLDMAKSQGLSLQDTVTLKMSSKWLPKENMK